ncbi:uncharacterized protein F4817DRAFT_336762 [Daldinia loculata]|uniref:uncharacterized protein n=1 Tax=Daldinia loculata TaxID=103429 RepID=UPI0020C3BB7B|nr:uncharacterized protein F4817DRAFT_336762 [Daldinia loculata]KAI1647474.1 hypothetical protein F4817DRAFT_336762 [Daldinia loculata]
MLLLPCTFPSIFSITFSELISTRTIAVTPSKLKTVPFEDACGISLDYAVTAIRALADLRHNQDWPLRFIYISGHFAPRSPAEMPKQLADNGLTLINYGLMRGRMDTMLFINFHSAFQ